MTDPVKEEERRSELKDIKEGVTDPEVETPVVAVKLLRLALLSGCEEANDEGEEDNAEVVALEVGTADEAGRLSNLRVRTWRPAYLHQRERERRTNRWRCRIER